MKIKFVKSIPKNPDAYGLCVFKKKRIYLKTGLKWNLTLWVFIHESIHYLINKSIKKKSLNYFYNFTWDIITIAIDSNFKDKENNCLTYIDNYWNLNSYENRDY